MKLFGRNRSEKALQKSITAILEDGKDIDSVLLAYPDLADELKPRLEAMLWLGQHQPTLEINPDLMALSTNGLLAQIQRASLTRPNRITRFRQSVAKAKHYQWVWNSTALVVLFITLVSVVYQALDWSRMAIPGDALYPTKLFLEKARLAFTFDPIKDARLRVDYSRQRSDEFSALVFEGRFEYLQPTAVAMQEDISDTRITLGNMPSSVRAQADQLNEKLNEMVESQNIILGLLVQAVPDQAKVGIETAMAITVSGSALSP